MDIAVHHPFSKEFGLAGIAYLVFYQNDLAVIWRTVLQEVGEPSLPEVTRSEHVQGERLLLSVHEHLTGAGQQKQIIDSYIQDVNFDQMVSD